MEENYRQAMSEMVEIIKYSQTADEEFYNKIPKEFIENLEKNKDESYTVNIDFDKENWEDTIKEETKEILALIYRDYLVSPEEREKLIAEEERAYKEFYSVDNLFKNRKKKEKMQETNTDAEQNTNSNLPAIIEPWYKKIYKMFLNFFRRNK